MDESATAHSSTGSLLRPWNWPRRLKGLVAGAAIALLLYVSLAPVEEVPGVELVWDKAEHAAAYLMLAGLGLALFPARATVVAALLLALGAAIELLQAAMGFGRQGDWRDLLANTLGMAAAIGPYLALRRIRRPS